MENASIIKTNELSYQYANGVQTLYNINLDVKKGSVYGFLGPNGSGKTTTLCLLLGLLSVQRGSIEIFGRALQADRINTLKKIGSLIETPSLYGHLSALENLEVYRRIYGASKARAMEVLEITGLTGTNRKTVKQFSLGMKQRLAIALSLLPNPELLVLDEPSNGLDPNGILELRELIKKLNKTYGMTIVISSHILAEVEKMVSHVGIISKGNMLFQGTLQDLYQFQQRKVQLFVSTSDNVKAAKVLASYSPQAYEEVLALPFHDLGQVAHIAKMLVNNRLDIHLINPQKQELEQLFMDLTSDQNEPI